MSRLTDSSFSRYTKKEQPLRVALWSSTVASVSLSTESYETQLTGGKVYVGLVSYGIGNASNVSIANWRLLFIILGSISMSFALMMFFFCPDRPEFGRFLSEREALVAIERKRSDNTGIENKVSISTSVDVQGLG